MAPGLEARYRRLLRWYPADHRAVHGDEMLGVLMAATPPGRARPAGTGRDRPGPGESADLLMGAVRIRLRPGRRLAVLFGVLAFLALLLLLAYRPGTLAAANVIVPSSEALVLCLLAVMVYRTRRRATSTDGGPGEGLA